MKIKNLKNTRILLLVSIFFLSFKTTFAQLNTGAGMVLRTNIENPGINIRGGYLIDKKINVSLDFTYFLPYKEEGISSKIVERTNNCLELNLNISYWIDKIDATTLKIVVYPIAGLNLTVTKESETIKQSSGKLETTSDPNTNIGFNIGGGVMYKINSINFFAEGKQIIGINQAALTVGALILFKWDAF